MVSTPTAMFQEYELSAATVDGAVWPFSQPDRKPAHFHGQIEFVVVRRGRARERVGTQVYDVHPGQLIWHLPGIEHEMIEASSDLDLRVVHVEPDLAVALALDSAADRGLRRSAAMKTAPRHAFSDWVRDLGWLASGRPVVELT